jgi:Holliday junction resolvase RusA-like endonuclease
MIRHYRLQGQPVALPRQRFTRTGRSYKPASYMKRKEADVFILRSSHLGDAIDGPIKMVIEFFHKRPKRLLRAKDSSNPIPKDKRPDIDNLSKHVLDCMQSANVIKDDGLVWHLTCIDMYCAKDEEPHTQITIRTAHE